MNFIFVHGWSEVPRPSMEMPDEHVWIGTELLLVG